MKLRLGDSIDYSSIVTCELAPSHTHVKKRRQARLKVLGGLGEQHPIWRFNHFDCDLSFHHFTAYIILHKMRYYVICSSLEMKILNSQ